MRQCIKTELVPYLRFALIQSPRACMNTMRNLRLPSLMSGPLLSNSLLAPPTWASGWAIEGAFRKTSYRWMWWLAPKPPMAPGDALMIAVGFLSHTLLPSGREPTSSVFFSVAGTDRLYSGVTNRTALQALTTLRNWVHASGGLLSASALCKGRLPISIRANSILRAHIH